MDTDTILRQFEGLCSLPNRQTIYFSVCPYIFSAFLHGYTNLLF